MNSGFWILPCFSPCNMIISYCIIFCFPDSKPFFRISLNLKVKLYKMYEYSFLAQILTNVQKCPKVLLSPPGWTPGSRNAGRTGACCGGPRQPRLWPPPCSLVWSTMPSFDGGGKNSCVIRCWNFDPFSFYCRPNFTTPPTYKNN